MSEDDIDASLIDLEKKLNALEDELRSAPRTLRRRADDDAPTPSAGPEPETEAAATAPELAGAPAEPEAASPVAAGTPSEATAGAGLEAAVEAALLFRETLERASRDLMAEYARMLDELQSATVAALAAVAGPNAASAPAAPPPSLELDAVLLDGMVVVEAGPFAEVVLLSAFERALAAIAGVRGVHLREFDGTHASLDVDLGRAVALGAELRHTAPAAFTITRATAAGLTVTIHAEG